MKALCTFISDFTNQTTRPKAQRLMFIMLLNKCENLGKSILASSRVVEGIIGWLTEKLSLHGYFPSMFTVNIARG